MSTSSMHSFFGKWQRELSVFSQLNGSIALTGNIYDMVPLYENGRLNSFSTLDQYLCSVMRRAGYTQILSYDMVRGFSDLVKADQDGSCGLKELQELIAQEQKSTRTSNNQEGGALSYSVHTEGETRYLLPDGLENAAHMIHLLMCHSKTLTGIIMRFTSQLVSRPDDLDLDERRMFLFLRNAIERARRFQVNTGNNQTQFLPNKLFLLVDKLNDMPAWFSISFPQLKVINIERPNYQLRESFIRNISQYFTGFEQASPEAQKRFVDKFVGQTEGLSFLDLNNIREIAMKYRFSSQNVDKAIMLYRYGVQDNPWLALQKEDLSTLEEDIGQRVMGQETVVRQAVDVIKRAIVGMSGLQHSSSGSKPRGILFLAGPTGTGKTELAKAITERIFKDERNMIRFDMSEYRQEQSDQRLLGAPPGYVGYEEGGQLTNAVREHPFSVLLFDEIEKAHPSLMDKFLQILEDGRITDGRGDTVYFQDCLIIFTSNLGISKPSETDPRRREVNVSYEQDVNYETVRTKVIEGVRSYFNDELGRPEILNRIGNNILVFNFIREDTMRRILKKQLDTVRERTLDDHKITVEFSQQALMTMTEFATAQLPLGQGGRGIGNIVEEKLINPLARYIFDNRVQEGEAFVIQEIETDQFGLPVIKADRGR